MNKKMISPVLGCALFLAFGIASVVAPQTKSQKEELASMPKLSVETLLRQDLAQQWNDYLSKHIVGREVIQKLSNQMTVFLSAPKVNDVFILEDRLIQNVSSVNPVTAKRNTEAVNFFAQSYPDLPVYFSLIPTAAAVYQDEMPAAPNLMDQVAVINGIYGDGRQQNNLSNSPPEQEEKPSEYGTLENIYAIDLHTFLMANKQQEIFYHTDSMWTSLGAYNAYSSLVTGMGDSAISKDLFNIEHAQTDYYGGLYEKTLIKRGDGDGIDLYTHAPDQVIELVKCYEGGNVKELYSLYFEEYLNTPQATNVFLGADRGVTEIETNLKSEHKLLLFGDEYSKPLLQFLSLHFQTVTFVNLNALTSDQYQLIDPDEYDSALFLYSVENYVSDTSLTVKLQQLCS
ncbi:DHHW family protein [Massiliimalia massiliensis]|uniref:DHHW family protein n=1 Tax=Massiliimalia massiliensis TaxID=1852384 RepID=UPI000985DF56|nr:DHHW family protein [Massiliimalia massiliensis]MBS1474019.1 hypothetical protein [Massiliimalia sp.]